MAVTSRTDNAPEGPAKRRALAAMWPARQDAGWRVAGRLAATVPFVGLLFVITVLLVKAWPAIAYNGLGFFTRSTWSQGTGYGQSVTTNGVTHPLGASYGAWPLIAGTLQSSAIALVLAVPLALGTAFAVTEWLPRPVARPLGMVVEMLAGVPSVIIGLWGIFILGPWLAAHVYPVIADHVPDVVVLRYWRNPVGHGEGLLTGGIVLALMVVPIIASTARDLFAQVPSLPKEGALALGMTEWEVARRVSLPWVRSGLVGATVLGLGRALGETIAIAMVTGSILGHVAPNIYSPMTTIAATIVTQLDGAQTDGTGFAVATLAEAALVLAVISVLVNAAARLIVARTGRHQAPVGA